MANVQQPDKLLNLFKDRPLDEHGGKWDGLWKEGFTPWDRGGPSMALHDVLADRPDLVPPPPGRRDDPVSGAAGPRKKAFVPGCGRGYDVLLLASFGYDAYGLDFSAEAIREARELEKRVVGAGDDGGSNLDVYKRDGIERGKVTWLTGDFFADDYLREAGVDSFDLIFDYTFFCALPVSARPAWARRMAHLLSPTGGRLVCLQWPSGKPWSTGGPPWGVRPEHYVAQLARPGEVVGYDAEGNLAEHEAHRGPQDQKSEYDGLKLLELIMPARTHKAGCLEDGTIHDRIAVFSH